MSAEHICKSNCFQTLRVASPRPKFKFELGPVLENAALQTLIFCKSRRIKNKAFGNNHMSTKVVVLISSFSRFIFSDGTVVQKTSRIIIKTLIIEFS